MDNNYWIPIGASENGEVVFNGTFDGQCHTIYNMVVPYEGLSGDVFGTIGTDGVVKCLTIEQGWFGNSACVADYNYGKVLFCIAKSYVDAPSFDEARGGVCRYNYGLLYGCQNYGFIEFSIECGGIVYRNEKGGTISQCANKGLLYTYGNTYTGTGTSGIAYYSYGWIYNCYNLGVAENGSNRSAGIVGYSNGGYGCGQVYNCYSLSGYPLQAPICISTGNFGKVENCFGNTKPGGEWYEAFCEEEFLMKLDDQLGPMASAWLPDTLSINSGLPITVAEYNYHIGNYKIQPELWGTPSSTTVNLWQKDSISLSGIECYFSKASLEITSDNLNVAEIVDGKIQLHNPGTVNILFHLDETEESTALDYMITITVKDHSYGDWIETIAATCTVTGEERRDCTNCDAFETRTISALGHCYEAVVTEPTGTDQGYTTHTCVVCGDSYIDSYVAAWCQIEDNWYHISTKLNETKGLDVDAASVENGSNIQIYSNISDWSQAFYVEHVGEGYYTIKNRNSGLVLDVAEASMETGTNVWQYEFNGTDAQLWRFIDAGEGYYYIVSKLNQFYLTVEGAKAEDRTNVCVCTADKSDAQMWKLVFATENLPVTKIFEDVSDENWFLDAVQYVYDNGMMSGDAGSFNPYGNMTRVMMVTTLYRLSGSSKVTDYAATSLFGDVEAGSWYEDAVNWAYNEGITTGYPDIMQFGVYDNVTREQLAVFLHRYAQIQGYDITVRTEIASYVGYDEISDYAKEAMEWAVRVGLISGIESVEDGVTIYDLAPKGNATRAQLATILMRFCEYYGI